MPQKQGGSQKARKTKISNGTAIGSKRQRPPELLLVSMGKGLAHRSKSSRPTYVKPSDE